MANKKKTEKPPSFEEAMDRLEDIVSDLESGRMPLNELVASYEKGSELLQTCQTELEAARARVRTLSSAGNKADGGSVSEEEFGADEGAAGQQGESDLTTLPADHELF